MQLKNLTQPYLAIKELLSQHIQTLDGIRGIAILLVVFHNVADDGIVNASNIFVKFALLVSGSGWIGVQLFFVLSGFLITGILLDGKGRTHQLRNFYIRRGLRIFPLYYAFLIFFFVLLPVLSSTPLWFAHSQKHQLWYWLYLVNWIQPFYRKLEFGHIWSLAIEEQFYLLWPLIVIHVRSKMLAYICLFLIISAIVFRFLLLHLLPEAGVHAAYTFTIARYDALAVGALLAIVVRNREWLFYLNKMAFGLIVSIFVTIVALILINHEFSPAARFAAEFHQTLIAFFFGLFMFYGILANIDKSTFLYRLLSTKILTQAGKYSYAIYLFHIPIKHIWYTHFYLVPDNYHGFAKLWPMIYNYSGILIISTILAIVSWNVLEQRCLKLKKHFPD